MLPTGDPLGTVVTMLATPFGRLDGLAIDTAGAGGWLPTGSLPDSTSEGIIDGLPSSVSFPRRKVVVDGPPWGKIVGQRSPDTAIAVAVEDGINHGPHLGLAWPPTGAAGGRRGFRTAHCWLVRSLGYASGSYPSRSRPPFRNRLLVHMMRRFEQRLLELPNQVLQSELLAASCPALPRCISGIPRDAAGRRSQVGRSGWMRLLRRRSVQLLYRIRTVQ